MKVRIIEIKKQMIEIKVRIKIDKSANNRDKSGKYNFPY